MARENGREPDYFSQVCIDEAVGFIIAGHETTSTSLCWGLKYLTDQPHAQTRLRRALKASFQEALTAKRTPSLQEMIAADIPYLDATIEEIIRCSAATVAIDREALVDTTILGHAIPKGTVVTYLIKGPSMTNPSLPTHTTPTSKDLEARLCAWDATDIGTFNPARWLGSVDGEEEQFVPTAGPQLTFGLGTRGCSVRKLACLEMRIFLVLLLWRFELLSCPEGLSGYGELLSSTRKPRQCYLRLREICRE
ncbi:cytochrome P450 [Aspergillus stella-maris]|uniref:cytochrome P450 n=1 Tax=Aspergillus stella-maris TaxID=1810926 RepID=UPI003CCCC5E0